MNLNECLLVGFFCVVIPAPFSLTEHFELSAPPSVIGNVGQHAILPCQISPGTQPHKMEVRWERIGDKYIDHIYHFASVTGQETFGPGYMGKVELLKEETTTGNMSLKMQKVQVNDEGTYRCIVKSSDWIAQIQTILHVAALGNVLIEVLGREGKGIKVACKAAGWYPKPELQWLPKNSQDPQLESKQDIKQLFSVWSSITVLGDSEEITCLVYERSYSSMKRESTILLSQAIFPNTFPWILAFSILLILLNIVAVGVLAYFRYKENRKESKRKRDEEEQQRLLENLQESFDIKCKNLQFNLEKEQQKNNDFEMNIKSLTSENKDLKKKLEKEDLKKKMVDQACQSDATISQPP